MGLQCVGRRQTQQFWQCENAIRRERCPKVEEVAGRLLEAKKFTILDVKDVSGRQVLTLSLRRLVTVQRQKCGNV